MKLKLKLKKDIIHFSSCEDEGPAPDVNYCNTKCTNKEECLYEQVLEALSEGSFLEYEVIDDPTD